MPEISDPRSFLIRNRKLQLKIELMSKDGKNFLIEDNGNLGLILPSSMIMDSRPISEIVKDRILQNMSKGVKLIFTDLTTNDRHTFDLLNDVENLREEHYIRDLQSQINMKNVALSSHGQEILQLKKDYETKIAKLEEELKKANDRTSRATLETPSDSDRSDIL